jgi:hypothetical protein
LCKSTQIDNRKNNINNDNNNNIEDEFILKTFEIFLNIFKKNKINNAKNFSANKSIIFIKKNLTVEFSDLKKFRIEFVDFFKLIEKKVFFFLKLFCSL